VDLPSECTRPLVILSGAKNPFPNGGPHQIGEERILRSAQNVRTARLNMAKLLWSTTQHDRRKGASHARITAVAY
jgi:hypothetical protein